ncbi:Rha family transcriptional regulator [Bacillus thuringiensis]|uniref:Rha family transcriptional regulator n=1 Tax=Bacillus thuringiensis TaxID=1428 RepID=UPI00164258DB|nr:phage regulatory protein/antirepressor Ant [Bacillus thuringiensis]
MNNQLTAVNVKRNHPWVFENNGEVVTDSLVVAEMFAKRHDNVKRDILETISKLDELKQSEEVKELGIDFSSLKFEECHYKADNGQLYIQYVLNFDAFMLVTMSYTTQKAMLIKMKYINEFNRMKEYIQSQQLNIPKTYAGALRLAADLSEKNEELQLENKTMQPKAEYCDIVLDSTGTYTPTQIATELGIRSGMKLNQILKEMGIQRKVNKQWVLYAEYNGKGYTDTSTYTFDKSDGSRGSSQQLRWTEKGRKFIHNLLGVAQGGVANE